MKTLYDYFLRHLMSLEENQLLFPLKALNKIGTDGQLFNLYLRSKFTNHST